MSTSIVRRWFNFEAMVRQHLPEFVVCADDPAIGYAIIPTWFLARRHTAISYCRAGREI
jgi:hypothetical protein